ncbi:Aste57867_22233 [Aphanomyces stellatus]|uniref:Aste57867_22233 protein n=1 Tax=Aphanomyces stellatus TaxID=120398 RepID=A0A485LLK6_9STRA|nr:hypothetical protein As57867_022164 [Aphanomyces stellatus]VFT98900.1 Aste57867_22233 [Aphanomyces stellatus]
MTSPVHLLPRGQSWGEDIRIYKASKAVVPWRPEQREPVRHITRYEKSREEREFDLIRAQYRDVQREGATKDLEIKQSMQALVDAKIKQSRYVQKFNLINHSSAEPEPVDVTLRPPNTRVRYNIVNHHELAVAPVHEAPPDALGKKMVESQHLGRPFSVISNKYHTDHDQRARAEAVHQKETATVKFNKTHTFNPLLVRYYDCEKEAAFLVARDAHAKLHGLDRDDLLPHGEQFCASRLYNLVNHTVLKPEKFKTVTNVDNRRLNVMKATKINHDIHARAQVLEDLTETRSLNRISHARNSQIADNIRASFDPVTNQPFEGRLRKARVPVRTHPKSNVWTRVQDGGGNTNNQLDKPQLPRIDRRPPSGMRPIEPEILYISHDKPVDPGGASVAPPPMTKQSPKAS